MLQGVPALDLERVPPPVYVTRGYCEPRTVCLSPCCPRQMQRSMPWRVEDFHLHKQLYKGKASLLYSATCRLSGMPVALKLYRKNKLSNLNWYQVEREIRIHSKLRHPNIIQLFASFEDAENIYLAQEFAAGGDLYEELKANGGMLPEKRVAASIIYPCMKALVYLHNLSIIHRDIKSENILLMADSTIKLADFGLSINHREERPVTRAGTLDMMAPEVLMCPEKSRPEENKERAILEYTAAVDAWAVGIVMFELLVGHPPFEKESRTETYEHIMYRAPVMPAVISEGAKSFITSALVKAVSKRPSVEDLMQHPWILEQCGLLGRPTADAALLPATPLKVSNSGRHFNISIDCTTGSDGCHQSGSSSSSAGWSDQPEVQASKEGVREENRSSVIQWAGTSLKTITKKLRKPVAHALAGQLSGSGPANQTGNHGGSAANILPAGRISPGTQQKPSTARPAQPEEASPSKGHACGGQMCTTGVRGDMSVQNATSNPQNRHQSLRPPALEPLRIPAAVAPDGKRLSELSLAQQRRSLLVTTSGLQANPPSPAAHLARPWMQRLPKIKTDLNPPSPKHMSTPSPLARRRRRMAGATDSSCSGALTLADTPKGGHFPSGAHSARAFGRASKTPGSNSRPGGLDSGARSGASPKFGLPRTASPSTYSNLGSGSMSARLGKDGTLPQGKQLLSARKLSFDSNKGTEPIKAFSRHTPRMSSLKS